MKDYHAQAKALRQQVAELDELIGHPIYCSKPGDEPKANRLWQEHIELLKLIYPKPDPHDHIQVTILDMYRDDALVLITSFADINRYHQAYDLLGWDYDLVSAQIDICECCDEHYLLQNRVEDEEGRGFCKRGCFLEDQFERRIEVDEQEYDRSQRRGAAICFMIIAFRMATSTTAMYHSGKFDLRVGRICCPVSYSKTHRKESHDAPKSPPI